MRMFKIVCPAVIPVFVLQETFEKFLSSSFVIAMRTWGARRWAFLFAWTQYIVCVNSLEEDVFHRRGKARVLSLFNVVRFPNNGCSGTSDTFKGTCLTSTECTAKGGTVLGACASGFGTCCMIATSTCGSQITENCTYIQNPGFPGTFDGSSSCNFNIQQCRNDICFIRLDFETFSTRQPDSTATATDGDCLDEFRVIAAVGTARDGDGRQITPPVICGENAGQHMYINAGRASHSDIQIMNTFNTATAFARKWNIKVSQIPCDTDFTPYNSDCTQYFTGVSGTVSSYNFAGSNPFNHLSSQTYQVCLRREEGRCAVLYVPTGDENSFRLDGSTNSKAGSGNAECRFDYIVIPQGVTPGVQCVTTTSMVVDSHDRYCGGTLNCADGTTTPNGVLSTYRPFGFKVQLNHGDTSLASADMDRGFSLNFMQQLC